jgi:hypothetical protein
MCVRKRASVREHAHVRAFCEASACVSVSVLSARVHAHECVFQIWMCVRVCDGKGEGRRAGVGRDRTSTLQEYSASPEAHNLRVSTPQGLAKMPAIWESEGHSQTPVKPLSSLVAAPPSKREPPCSPPRRARTSWAAWTSTSRTRPRSRTSGRCQSERAAPRQGRHPTPAFPSFPSHAAGTRPAALLAAERGPAFECLRPAQLPSLQQH